MAITERIGISRDLAGLAVLFVALVPAIAKLIFYPSYPGSDDAFIHIAVAEHILDGEGWSIQPGGSVNLSSSPLFTVILLPVFAVASIGVAQLLSLLFTTVALVLTFTTVRRATKSTPAAFAALAAGAGNVHLWRWSGTVMETSLGYLLVALIAACALPLIERREPQVRGAAVLGVTIGVGTLVRFEIGALLLIALFALGVAWRVTGVWVVAIIGGFVVAVLPWIVFAAAVFGTPVPTTFFAKASRYHLFNVSITKSLGAVVTTGFGVSIAIAVVAVMLVIRNGEQSRLRERLLPLAFLIAWPVLLFAFYYVKTDNLQSAARYYLPGMATWPIALGLIIAAVPATHARVFAAASALCVVAAIGVNATQIAPTLQNFNGGYRAAMAGGAEYLRSVCRPGDVALVYVDIGILARDGIGSCRLADGGALASPELRGLTLVQQIEVVRPDFVVQSIGHAPNELAAKFPQLQLLRTTEYVEHGISKAGAKDYLNIYATTM